MKKRRLKRPPKLLSKRRTKLKKISTSSRLPSLLPQLPELEKDGDGVEEAETSELDEDGESVEDGELARESE